MTAVLTNMCMLQDAKGRVLVQDRLPKPDNPWAGLTFPGGHVEPSESIVESMIREFKEETGLTISNLTNCGYIQWYNPKEDSQYIIFCFKATSHRGRLKSSPEGKMSWMPLAEMRSGTLAPNMEKYLDVFCGESVLQTYGVANCWEEVIKDGTAIHKIENGIIVKNMHMKAITRRKFCAEIAATSIVVGISPNAVANSSEKAKPFVKWAGGKGQLIEQLESLFPSDLATREDLTYVEPFVGGGAMVFYMLSKYKNIKRVVINDFNGELVNTYKTIRDNPDALIDILERFQNEYRSCETEAAKKEYYLKKRLEYNQRTAQTTETAALFIFLNRTCFNGLYRVNSNGLYNVPFGRAANPLICDKETLLADSALLKKVEILNGDFEGVYEHIKGKAFVYFDPPYRPLPKTPSFTAYSKDGFDDEQQRRLAAFCRKLDKDGHQWLLSNSDPANTDPSDKFFDEIFSGFDINRVSASRMINSKADGRGKITELAIRNYRR